MHCCQVGLGQWPWVRQRMRPTNSWYAQDIEEVAALGGPGSTSSFIISYPDPVDDAGLDGSRPGLDIGDGFVGSSTCVTNRVRFPTRSSLCSPYATDELR
jgi:hypothetical protein